MESSGLITLAMLFLTFVIGLCCWLTRFVRYHTNRYTVDTKKALKQFACKLERVLDVPQPYSLAQSEMTRLDNELNASLFLFEEITGKIHDETSRLYLESSFMVVRGTQHDTPIRICVANTIFSLSTTNHNHHSVMKVINDFNNRLAKIVES
ncbi:hypothetical protein SIMMY50_265 [Erwinia phage vB_EamM_Simmy50]|uniref:Uncharacterized protein n=1 Tax=Erwinia phage vB_EamM_Simmy50 TaxID=1815988 RepID=A0A173GDT1_9CAUD|nr:hypothetical protein FDH99_gp261 [Erwinia phage vB_EamM_Simmy50]ANH51723.1 hypothetical protein SIMMY50_265 [Erwinia phage vB_EamM_Simmy50]